VRFSVGFAVVCEAKSDKGVIRRVTALVPRCCVAVCQRTNSRFSQTKKVTMRPTATKLLCLLALLGIAASALPVTARAQSSSGFGGIMSYDPQNQWILFTDTTGTWHAPLAITNSVAPADSVVEFTVNTDDQFVIQQYAGGNPQSFLDLDSDGSASIYGSGGGGVGVDGASGDTCIPSTRPNPCSALALRVSTDGVLTQYQGHGTFGNGMATILYSADATLSGSFGPYTILTTNASGYGSGGMYRISGYMTVTSSAPSSTMQFRVTYTDESGPQAETSGIPAPFGSVGDKIPFSLVFYCASGTPIDISLTAAGGSPSYTFHIRLEEL
jgi:hypothetical protein